jgi:hypothetical protein
MLKQLYMLTWCNQVENLYGTTLIFTTLRIGFPNTNICVVDNASLLTLRPQIRQLAQEADCEFIQLDQEIKHDEFLEQTLSKQSEGTAIFVDPDICFWKSVEDWNFDALVAGRLIPKHSCEYTRCITYPRLHTSLLWIPDIRAFRSEMETLRGHFFQFSPFRPFMFRLNNLWHRFDTGASLYAALPNRMFPFVEKELEAYDHLFCGTHLESVAAKVRPDYGLLFERMHKHAQVDYRALKGAWRIQEEYFQSLAV